MSHLMTLSIDFLFISNDFFLLFKVIHTGCVVKYLFKKTFGIKKRY